ncbi:MAG: hypothetical protein KJ002_01845 [Candidatus Dadabacteria bacterium]|nr:hypothetical protein [Candidatus Dadabacteria bacterium]
MTRRYPAIPVWWHLAIPVRRSTRNVFVVIFVIFIIIFVIFVTIVVIIFPILVTVVVRQRNRDRGQDKYRQQAYKNTLCRVHKRFHDMPSA